jgi:hypothetical protein
MVTTASMRVGAESPSVLSLSHRCHKATVATAVVNHRGLVAGRYGAPPRCRSAPAHPPIGGHACRWRGPRGRHPVVVTSIAAPPSSPVCLMSMVVARFSAAQRRERGKRIMRARVFAGRSSSSRVLFTRNHHTTVEWKRTHGIDWTIARPR